MKIYFACSITGGREYEKNYQVITRYLQDQRHEVPTAHLAESNILDLERVVVPSEVYARDVDWIQASDILIAEVSVPSHGVGYEIGYALNLGKPVLCLHKAGRAVSKMITGNPDSLLSVKSYEDIEQALKEINLLVNNVTQRL